MRMTNDDTKPSIEEALQHYGVKGMKWGVRRDRQPAKNVDRHLARKKQNARIKKARTTTEKQRRALQVQADKTNDAKPGAKQAAEYKKYAEMRADYLKNPDRATALRLTTGEKAAFTVLAIAAPGVGTASVGAYTTGVVARRKAIERQQRG